MPRPIRIEYEDAYYHVMNRGRGRQFIFHSEAYYQAFFDTLSEVCERFDLVVHAYCLMSNHYHLLLQTPQANLGRIMRHINGVYTQRYNRLKHTDGPLFRGRYKAILVDEDGYLLQLSRYIHRNPIEMKRPLVSRLESYLWSSYPAYINQAKAPDWLEREKTYQMLGQHQKYQGYQSYVEQGIDEEIKQFYNRGNIASVIGNKEFIEWLHEEKIPELEEKDLVKNILPKSLMIERVVQLVSDYYKLDPEYLTRVVKGPQKGLLARKVAMYLCQQLGGYKLSEIMTQFGLSNIGSVSFITSQIRKRLKNDRQLKKQVQQIKDYVIKNAT